MSWISFGIAAFMTMTVFYIALVLYDQTHHTVYAVGDCLEFDRDYERWESRATFKVIEIGKAKYLVRAFGYDENGEMSEIGISISMQYRQVECPKELR